FMRELASFIETTPSSLQRELNTLVESGILRSRRDGNRLYFQAESDSPIFAPLRDLLVQTLGVTENIKEALSAFKEKINIAFIYGSVARKEENTQSDVDLMIIGSSGLAEISPILRDLERKFNREINATCYNLNEFQKKVGAGNHFLTQVLRKEKIFLIGDENELAEFIGERQREHAHNQPAGN
ncbi:MAG TPA: nucleotidyltransferase domain-containing protein, partial [Pyrinomonadaceae bacterium]|nr:nucleotidyltransferase domain-containing protein [Pyrinomonadaceae bacterium]